MNYKRGFSHLFKELSACGRNCNLSVVLNLIAAHNWRRDFRHYNMIFSSGGNACQSPLSVSTRKLRVNVARKIYLCINTSFAQCCSCKYRNQQTVANRIEGSRYCHPFFFASRCSVPRCMQSSLRPIPSEDLSSRQKSHQYLCPCSRAIKNRIY